MDDLSPRQAEICQFTASVRAMAPAFREIAEGVGLSLASAREHIEALKGKGYIAWDDRAARSIHIVKQAVN